MNMNNMQIFYLIIIGIIVVIFLSCNSNLFKMQKIQSIQYEGLRGGGSRGSGGSPGRGFSGGGSRSSGGSSGRGFSGGGSRSRSGGFPGRSFCGGNRGILSRGSASSFRNPRIGSNITTGGIHQRAVGTAVPLSSLRRAAGRQEGRKSQQGLHPRRFRNRPRRQQRHHGGYRPYWNYSYGWPQYYWWYNFPYYYDSPYYLDLDDPCDDKALEDYKWCIDVGTDKEECVIKLEKALDLCYAD